MDSASSVGGDSESVSDGEFDIHIYQDETASLNTPLLGDIDNKEQSSPVNVDPHEQLQNKLESMSQKQTEFEEVAAQYAPFANIHIAVSLFGVFLFVVFLLGTPLAIAILLLFGGWKEEVLWLLVVGACGTAFTLLVQVVLRQPNKLFFEREKCFSDVQDAATEVLSAVHKLMLKDCDELQKKHPQSFGDIASLRVECRGVIRQPFPSWWFLTYPIWVVWGLLLAFPLSFAFDVRSAFGALGGHIMDKLRAADTHFCEQLQTFSNAVSRVIVSQIFSYIKKKSSHARRSFNSHIQSIVEQTKANYAQAQISCIEAPLKKRGRGLVKIQEEYMAESYQNRWWASVLFITNPITWGVVQSEAILVWFLGFILNRSDQAKRIHAKRGWFRRFLWAFIGKPLMVVFMLLVLQVTLTINLATVVLALPVVILRGIILSPFLPVIASRGAERLGDVCRQMIVCHSLEEIAFLHRKLVEASLVENATWRIIRFKNRFAEKDDGFIELLYNLQHFEDGKPGVVCELQITHKIFYDQRANAHAPYKIRRAKSIVLLVKDLVEGDRNELQAQLTSTKKQMSTLRKENGHLHARIRQLEALLHDALAAQNNQP